jgi:peptidoglycan hydrolase-like protein with peptidoglycan-binding domain
MSSGTSSVALEAQLQSLLALLANLERQAAKQPISAPGATLTPPLFTKTLYFGMSGTDVKRLQELLAEDPAIYPEGKITGYFGTLTLKAVQRFQKKYGIASSGDPGYGHVGPLTRAKLNSLIEQGMAP